MKWNKLEDIKPKGMNFYLCFLVEVNDLGISRYQDLKFWNDESFDDVSVKYWMPLPEPPKDVSP